MRCTLSRKSENGIALLESLVALALLGIVLAFSYPTVRSSLVLERAVRAEEQRRIQGELARSAVLGGYRRTLALFPLGFFGTYSELSASALELDRSLVERAARFGSGALILLEPDTTFTAAAVPVPSGDLAGCMRSTRGVSEIRAWYAISVDRTEIVRAIARVTTPSGGVCGPDALVVLGGFAMPRAVGFVALRDAYLLTLDRADVFRRISLLTPENQPIAREISRFEARREADGALMVQVDSGAEHPVTFTLTFPPMATVSYEPFELFL